MNESKFQIFVSIKIRSSLIFENFENPRIFFVKIRKLFLFCFTMYTENVFTINLEDGRPIRLVFNIFTIVLVLLKNFLF